MHIKPDPTWGWIYHQEEELLALSFGEQWLFFTPYSGRTLIEDARYSLPFSTVHAAYYENMLEKLRKSLSLADAQLVQIVLNMTAARFFCVPMMPKSWFFSHSEQIVYPSEGKLVELATAERKGLFVIVEASDPASLVMCLESSLQLDERKRLSQFELIKVMNDRLLPLEFFVQENTAEIDNVWVA